MLESAEFVGSFETKQYVYMIARETTSGCSSAGDVDSGTVLRARVMRVCKSDRGAGAQHIYRNRNRWTSFVKVRLRA